MQAVDDFRGYESMHSTYKPWVVCFAATLFFFYEFIQGNMFASLAANIMQDYNIQADKMAYLSSIYYLANVLFLFVAGMVLDRFSVKYTLLITMLLCVISTFVLAASHSFVLALACRFVTGIGSAFCFLGPVRLASQWFLPKRMALVTGVIVTMAMTGGLIAQYPLTQLVASVGWRPAVQYVGFLGLAMCVLMYWGIQEKPAVAIKKMGQPLKLLDAARRAYCNLQYIRAALYASLMNMTIAVFGAMMGTLYLEQRLHATPGQASMVNGMLFLGAMAGAPLLGWVSDRMGLRIRPMKLSVLISLSILVIALYAPVSIPVIAALFFLLGFFTSAQVISYALVAESSPPAMTATAVSVISIVTQGGYFVFQNLFSSLLVRHGSAEMSQGLPVYSLAAYQYAALMLPLGLILAFILLFGLKETHCHQVEH